MDTTRQSEATMESAKDRRRRDALRIKSLHEGICQYRDHNKELLQSYCSLKKEMDSRMRAMEAQQLLMASQLEEKERQLKEALAANNLSKRKYIQFKSVTERMFKVSNELWESRWRTRELQFAEEEKTLRKEDELQVTQPRAELKTLQRAPPTQNTEVNIESLPAGEARKQVLVSQLEQKHQLLKEAVAARAESDKRYRHLKMVSENMHADSNRNWVIRWNAMEKSVAEKEDALLKQHRQQVARLTAENEALRRKLTTSAEASTEPRWGPREVDATAQLREEEAGRSREHHDVKARSEELTSEEELLQQARKKAEALRRMPPRAIGEWIMH